MAPCLYKTYVESANLMNHDWDNLPFATQLSAAYHDSLVPALAPGGNSAEVISNGPLLCRNMPAHKGLPWHRAYKNRVGAASIEWVQPPTRLQCTWKVMSYRDWPDHSITARSGRGTSCTYVPNHTGTERSCRFPGRCGRPTTGNAVPRSSDACWPEPCLRRG